jgi:monoamine oxidase
LHDAIVIGAGLSGLVCARTLMAGGARVRVLEARDRVGGRLLTGDAGGALVDLGGQWLTAGQTRLLALANELDVATYEHVRSGRAIIDEAGGLLVRTAAAFIQQRAIARIERLMATVPIDDPVKAPDAGLLDRVSLASYLDENVRTAIARERIRLHSDLVFAADPADLSLLSYLATLRATEGFKPSGSDLPGGGREHRFVGGAQQLALRLAADLDVLLDAPVRAIDQREDRVVVRCEPGGEHEARRVVVALSPALVGKIAIELPPAHRQYADGVRMGSVVKAFAAYARPFWRDRGLSGEVFRPRGVVRAVVEMAGQPPALLAFIVGPHAARWHERTSDDRRGEVLETLEAYFGEAAARPIAYVEKDWAADAWSAGCVAATVPGTLARGGRWREAFGRVHIAGTESAVHWPGYMDGAIEAGERAAAEVLATLAQ